MWVTYKTMEGFRVVAGGFLVFLLTTNCAVLCDVCEIKLNNKRVVPECEDDIPIQRCGDASVINCVCGVVEKFNRTVASCNLNELQYIPAFSFDIDTLCIDSLVSNHNENADFFANVSTISAIEINGDIDSLDPATFKGLQNLTRLSLISRNRKLSETDALHILEAVPALTALGLIKCGLSSDSVLLNTPFQSLQNLEFIDMGDNLLKSLHLNPLQTVRRADFSINLLIRVHVQTQLPNLEELILAQNSLPRFLDTCSESGEPYFPNLLQLDLKFNKLSNIPKEFCLPKLRVLVLDGNTLMNGDSVSLRGSMFPSLIVASLIGTIEASVIYFSFTDMPMLQCVYLSNNKRFGITGLTQTFVNCPQLWFLDIAKNVIADDRGSSVPLKPQQSVRSVQHLNLSSCNLGSNSDVTALSTLISILPNLAVLDLSSNNLQFISSGLFDGLLKLRRLDLSSNFLTGVSRDLFSAATRGRLQTLDFSDNLFSCSCDILWFKFWIASSPNKFVATEDYWCVSGDRVPDIPLLDFNLSEQACLMSHAAYVAITYVTLFSLLFPVITVSFWRYKWHLRLLLYDMFRGPGDARLQRLQHGHFDYDVFVSYDSDDQLWVFGKLLPELEGRLGLKLCLHERDFVPGTQIIDNIAKCVEASKKILMVWSRNFVDSKWCQFELTYCLQHTMDTEDALVIVCLDDVTSTNDVTTAMMAVLKTTTYIQWVGERRGQAALDSFWGRLRVALKEVIPDPVHHV